MNNKKVIFYLILVLFSLFIASLLTNYDWDLFARLIVGERIVEAGIFPYTDFLSYTPTHAWFDHEWGSGLCFYLFLKYFGAFGLILLQAVLMFFTTYFVLKTINIKHPKVRISLLYAVFFESLLCYLSPNLVRSHMFSFFFFSLFLFILEQNRIKQSNTIWLIPILTIIWNNLHGGVVSGLGLIFMYIAGSIPEKNFSKKLLAVLAVSCFCLIINPYGINYLSFLLSAATMTRKYVVEWWPFYHAMHVKHFILPVLYCVICFLITILRNIKQKNCDWTKNIVFFVTLVLGIVHVKLIPLAIISVTAFSYYLILSCTKCIRKLLKIMEKSISVTVVVMSLLIPLLSPNLARAEMDKLPLYEIEFLKVNNMKGNLVLPFGMGSYASYKLYPNNLIFMDGRYEEVYNDKEFLVLRDFELAEPNWRDIVNYYPTDILMPPKYAEIYSVLKDDYEWVEIFEGFRCGIFVRKKDVKNEYIEPESDILYYRKTMFEHYDWKLR